MRQHLNNNRQAAFALLLAIVIATLVVSIGVALSTIAFKELTLSSTLTDSEAAYYAAKSGADCAKEWISGGPALTGTTGGTISCNNQSIDVLATTINSLPANTFTVNFPPQAYTAFVTVTLDSNGNYTVDSKGYNNANTSDPKRVERDVTEEVGGTFCLTNTDLMIVVDTSGSIKDSDDLNDIKLTIQDLLAATDFSSNNIGIVIFASNLDGSGNPDPSNDASVLQSLTNNEQDLSNSTNDMVLTNSATDVEAGLNLAEAQFPDDGKNHAMLVITDGVPTKSSERDYENPYSQGYIDNVMDDTANAAASVRDSGVTIYALGLMNAETPGDGDYNPSVDDGTGYSRRPFVRDRIASAIGDYFDVPDPYSQDETDGNVSNIEAKIQGAVKNCAPSCTGDSCGGGAPKCTTGSSCGNPDCTGTDCSCTGNSCACEGPDCACTGASCTYDPESCQNISTGYGSPEPLCPPYKQVTFTYPVFSLGNIFNDENQDGTLPPQTACGQSFTYNTDYSPEPPFFDIDSNNYLNWVTPPEPSMIPTRTSTRVLQLLAPVDGYGSWQYVGGFCGNADGQDEGYYDDAYDSHIQIPIDSGCDLPSVYSVGINWAGGNGDGGPEYSLNSSTAVHCPPNGVYDSNASDFASTGYTFPQGAYTATVSNYSP